MTIHVRVAFLCHILVELPASIGFFLHPSATLAVEQPEAHAVIRQYALLLNSTNLIAWVFLFAASSDSARRVAAALALYHTGPMMRAWGKIRVKRGTSKILAGWSEPRLHLGVHGICVVALLGEALRLW